MKIAQAIVNGSPMVIAQAAGETWREVSGETEMLSVLERDYDQIVMLYRRGAEIDPGSARFLAPIRRPGKILAIGQNYMDHIREQNGTPPPKPLIFAKFPSSILDPNGVITWDPELSSAVDFEAELAVIIGRETRHVSVDQALDYVFGYTCANDVTARDLQRGDGQWTRGKGLDTFCPLGPWIVTADEIPDPQALKIRCEVNGTALQDSTTAEMIFDVKTLISYCSQAFTLHPGDIILTGTPAGVGFFRTPPIVLHNGNKIVVEVEKIGRLENTCREVTANVS